MGIINERYYEILKELELIRRQVELLESHKTVQMIDKAKYEESGMTLVKRVEAIERELGLEEKVDAKTVIYDKTKPTVETDLDAEIFNHDVHKAIDDVLKSDI